MKKIDDKLVIVFWKGEKPVFDRENDYKTDDVIEEILQADFVLPKAVEEAKQEAFEKIRAQVNETQRRDDKMRKRTSGSSKKKMKKRQIIYKTALGMTAAVAVFSTVCISNPAFAENIPLIGSVFEKLGNSLGFSGEFEQYAKPVEETADLSQEKEMVYSKTVNGTTVTLSEIYCNDTALYLSLTIQTEKDFPDTSVEQNGNQSIMLGTDSKVRYSFKEDDESLFNAYLDGKVIDTHTYAGVLRIAKKDMTIDHAGIAAFDEAREAFWLENGIDVNAEDFDFDKVAEVLGMDSYQDSYLPQVGGPDQNDYIKEIIIPDQFSMTLNIQDIIGQLPQEQVTTPEMPQDLLDEYARKMQENGISTDDADYEDLTQEQKEIEHQLFSEMWNQYYERYPDAALPNNKYDSWTLDGNWEFQIDVEKNTTDNIEKEVNVVDENGEGIISLVKTPFEITMNVNDSEGKYFPVLLDADGDLMSEYGMVGSADTVAVQNRDVSTVYVYLCNCIEYMDELKGYYWSEDYDEKAKTKTFKELLDERAVASAQVQFDS